MTAIAIIPARGGSKRVPRKNIKAFHGRPMIAYSIQAALESGLFARVVVSTDDTEIAEVARSWGAEVPFVRPAELADDHAGTVEVIQHAVAALREQGEDFAYACCLYATAPFVTPADLARGLGALEDHPDKAYAFTVTDYASPVQRALRLRPDGGVESLYPEFYETRSQDLEPAFHDAGQFYWGRTEAWAQGAPLHAPHSLPVRLPRHRVQDIDTAEDWRRAELLYGALLTDLGRSCAS
ncbi:pseudaminic acid cytidylyltransferase [Pseudomonas oryzihabitans]|uniref:pseudaminic acid cytidylyltransferase n=1 Tax=Pseudomonas oryzihabitans TaxID=47885 RepID=UPI00241D49A6|nr:pseudaminic acid cytidylyltransferase [Pseudomonas oryzihabitans]